MKPSTITRPALDAAARRRVVPGRPRRRPSRSTLLWPLPDDDITGLTTHGKPIARAAARNSSSDRRSGTARSAGRAPRPRAGGCPRGSSSAAPRARSGCTVASPRASSSTSVVGRDGLDLGHDQVRAAPARPARRSAAASIMSITCDAMRHLLRRARRRSGRPRSPRTPSRCSSMTTSLPSSPEPSSSTRVAAPVSGVPMRAAPWRVRWLGSYQQGQAEAGHGAFRDMRRLVSRSAEHKGVACPEWQSGTAAIWLW